MATQPQTRAVQLVPVSFQVMGDKSLPARRGLRSTVWRWRGRRCFKLWLSDFYAPLVSMSALFSFLTIPFLLFFLLAFGGDKAVVDRSTLMGATALATIAALPVWAVLIAIITPFRILAEEKKVGGWQGSKFIYLEPKLIVTAEVQAGDGMVEFKVEGIPEGTVIDYRVDVEGAPERLNCVLFGAFFVRPIEEILSTTRFAPRGKVVLRRGHSLRLMCRTPDNSVPMIVRVYALSWEIDRTFALEYTDQGKGVRILIRDPSHVEPAQSQESSDRASRSSTA
jgi:hypothetical protein